MTPFESLVADFAKKTGLSLEADAKESFSISIEYGSGLIAVVLNGLMAACIFIAM